MLAPIGTLRASIVSFTDVVFEADVILLLISSDFLHSDFCYLIETRNALDRHAQGQALVIPVVLRDVDFKGLPIAELQMLPKDARAVTSGSWKSEDEAFKNVCGGNSNRDR